jgi:hypothetical protein
MATFRGCLLSVTFLLLLSTAPWTLRAQDGPEPPQPSASAAADSANANPQGAESGKAPDRAIAAALDWLARHQLPDGSWSLTKYTGVCRDPTCAGPGREGGDAAATALGLLPFLAAGQTQKSQGSYGRTVQNGLCWLQQNQKPDGDLRCGDTMYAHGLAAIALCEAYGLSRDRTLGFSAQAAVNFLQKVQNPNTGGWRYAPGDEGDTSVLGWQLQALQSARRAGLQVADGTLDGAGRWLKSVAAGEQGGKASYRPGGGPTPTMTAVALLGRQFLGAKSDDPAMVEGRQYLMAQSPDRSYRNCYNWYYATQVLHHVGGADWDRWYQNLSQRLLDSQCHDGCAAGSWDPQKPVMDVWGQQGGRVMVTSLSALTLQVANGQLLLFSLDAQPKAKPAQNPN